MRRLLLLLATLGALAAMTSAGVAATTRACGDAERSDQFGKLSATGIFGLFHITATGTTCTNAKTTAKTWLHHEATLSNPGKPYTTSNGYRCTTSAKAAQGLIVACRKGSAHVGFKWEIANG